MATARLHIAVLACLLLAAHALRSSDGDENGGPGNPILDTTLDHRRNVIGAAVAETLWCVRVLHASKVPNTVLNKVVNLTDSEEPSFSVHDVGEGQTASTNMDILWAYVKALRADGLTLKDTDGSIDDVADRRNEEPAALIAAISAFRFGFKLGMDNYIADNLAKRQSLNATSPPECGPPRALTDREKEGNGLQIFQERGRFKADITTLKKWGLYRPTSLNNQDAGIATQESVPAEAKGFFPEPIPHDGKCLMQRVDKEGGQLYADLGAPFCAGASGSIKHVVLAMESDGENRYKDGMVPCNEPKVREAILGLMTATLIATGQHSLAECLAAAQGLGYFTQIPSVLEDYVVGAAKFEEYLADTLGLSVGPGEERPLVARRQLLAK